MSRLTPVAAIVVLICSARAVSAQELGTNPSVIVTNGEAVISVPPDRAVVQIAAEGRAPKAGEAQRLAADAMTSLLAALKTVGLPADAIKTTGYTLNPENDYVNGRASFRDYLARNQIQVQVDELAKLSTIIDASGASGASVVTGLRFDVKNRATVEQTALKQAVADAIARANVIAAGANRTLGAIVRIQEQRNFQPNYYNFDSFEQVGGGRGGGQATPITPGQIEIRGQVTLTVAIK
jgi:hypothetical protein